MNSLGETFLPLVGIVLLFVFASKASKRGQTLPAIAASSMAMVLAVGNFEFMQALLNKILLGVVPAVDFAALIPGVAALAVAVYGCLYICGGAPNKRRKH